MDGYILSEADIASLKQFIEAEQNDPYRGQYSAHEEQQASSPDVYIAVPPCGIGIPGRVGATPGMQDCCIFKIVVNNSTFEIVPIRQVGSGANVQRTVYNIYENPWPPLLPPNEKYIKIKRDKFGKWLCEPYQGVGYTTTSTTTTTPIIGGLPVFLPAQNPCNGQCKWTWGGSYWNLDAPGCTTTTTTTTTTSTTTSSGSITTTTVNLTCLCGTSTTTTTSSTTTTPCSFCFYPDFCGTEVGQCYSTSCAPVDVSFLIKISCTTSTTTTTPVGGPTTTTTCNCATTSTAGPCPFTLPVCENLNSTSNCTWTYDYETLLWTLVWQGCLSCPPPPAGAAPCEIWTSFCYGPGVCPTLPIPCSGHGGGGGGGGGGGDARCPICDWMWVPHGWVCFFADSFYNAGPGFWTSPVCPCYCGDSGVTCSCDGVCIPPSAPGVDWNTPEFFANGGCCAGVGCSVGIPQGAYAITKCLVCPDSSLLALGYCQGTTPSGSTTTPSGSTTTTTAGSGTTTTAPPFPALCVNCAPSTTSTTTTTPSCTPPIGPSCIWQCDGTGGWSQQTNPCISSCACATPIQSCNDTCTVTQTGCNTTSSSSTTTLPKS